MHEQAVDVGFGIFCHQLLLAVGEVDREKCGGVAVCAVQKKLRMPRDASLVIAVACAMSPPLASHTFSTPSYGAKNARFFPSGESAGAVRTGFPKNTSRGVSVTSNFAAAMPCAGASFVGDAAVAAGADAATGLVASPAKTKETTNAASISTSAARDRTQDF